MRVVFSAVSGMVLGGLIVWIALFSTIFHGERDADVAVHSETKVALFEMAASKPVQIRIPSIGVEAPFEAPLGVNADKTIAVPESYETVGWYKYSPTPGVLGPSVVLGHVDSYRGPAVFFNLKKLSNGDRIFIDREDGSTATFVVESLERHEQEDFPTEKVYSDLDYAGLRLITCTGTYNHSILEYTHNLIVFARLIEG